LGVVDFKMIECLNQILPPIGVILILLIVELWYYTELVRISKEFSLLTKEIKDTEK